MTVWCGRDAEEMYCWNFPASICFVRNKRIWIKLDQTWELRTRWRMRYLLQKEVQRSRFSASANVCFTSIVNHCLVLFLWLAPIVKTTITTKITQSENYFSLDIHLYDWIPAWGYICNLYHFHPKCTKKRKTSVRKQRASTISEFLGRPSMRIFFKCFRYRSAAVKYVIIFNSLPQNIREYEPPIEKLQPFVINTPNSYLFILNID